MMCNCRFSRLLTALKGGNLCSKTNGQRGFRLVPLSNELPEAQMLFWLDLIRKIPSQVQDPSWFPPPLSYANAICTMSDLKSLRPCKVSLAPDAIKKYERSRTMRTRIKENEFVRLLWEDRTLGRYTDVALVAGDGTR